jgi:hypothetical protein
MLQVNYNISFEIMSQRFNNNNVLVEQGRAIIENTNIS